MVSKNQKKLIRSLKQKKYRKQNGLFVVEGIKVINEFLNTHFKLQNLYVLNAEMHLFNNVSKDKLVNVNHTELNQISFLTTPQKALAVFKIPEEKNILTNSGLQLALDDVKDPGNLGTIIRLCDWFGIEKLICSAETVDCYNPKVVQATMGSLTRVKIEYLDLKNYIENTNLPVFGAFMNGENVYKSKLPENALLIMGNEANGISSDIETRITKKISIPRFGKIKVTESLNVATATAVLLSEFRR